MYHNILIALLVESGIPLRWTLPFYVLGVSKSGIFFIFH